MNVGPGEILAFFDVVISKGGRRRTAPAPASHLRRGIVGRRRDVIRGLNSGEAAVIGGDKLFG